MKFLDESCVFRQLTSELLSKSAVFGCGKESLNNFFQSECIAYSSDLMGKTYCFTLSEDPTVIVCAFVNRQQKFIL